MYSGPLHRPPFVPDESAMMHQKMREEYTQKLLHSMEEGTEDFSSPPVPAAPAFPEMADGGIRALLEKISPEDSALISLIVFLLCDNTDNDVVLLGILLYVLLSK